MSLGECSVNSLIFAVIVIITTTNIVEVLVELPSIYFSNLLFHCVTTNQQYCSNLLGFSMNQWLSQHTVLGCVVIFSREKV